MEIIQVILIIFAVFALSRTILRFRDNKVSTQGMIFWSVLWLALIVLSFVPWVMTYFAHKLGISGGTGLIVYLSIMLLFYLVFRIYVMIEAQNQTITKLVREIAIRERKKK